MAFPPRFLDEIRARVACSEVIGRRVRLVKKAREYTGLCPFHNEKTPSFTVNDDKGFFHCFGCGAHGDVIGFTMRIDRLSFPEAVERLAAEAGLEMPRQSPADRARVEAEQTLYEVVEAACAWFEAQLRAPGGRVAWTYLHDHRGLDEMTIAAFRLGYAPDGRNALKTALLAKGFREDLMLQAGLIVRPDDGRDSFDFFRGRVMFPISDRRGRVIAFGGRVMGDGQPKYLNSRDTPLFDKGRTLYALDKAREALRRADGAAVQGPVALRSQLIVAEGYMDVIALHAAGFGGAVAPLGTALTEAQIEALWKLAPEPVLCLDGDVAGQRAALRAAERAIPLLRPGFSIRFANLPPGEDPDSVLRNQGPTVLAECLERARTLADTIWEATASTHIAHTPEQRALLEQTLESLALKIADRTVQWQYRRLFRLRIRSKFFDEWLRSKKAQADSSLKSAGQVVFLSAVPERVLLATVINHIDILASRDIADEFERFEFSDQDLRILKDDLMHDGALDEQADAPKLQVRLRAKGHGPTLDRLLSRSTYLHAPFAKPQAGTLEAALGWRAYWRGIELRRIREELHQAIEAFARSQTPENLTRVEAFQSLYLEKMHDASQRDLFEIDDRGGAKSGFEVDMKASGARRIP